MINDGFEIAYWPVFFLCSTHRLFACGHSKPENVICQLYSDSKQTTNGNEERLWLQKSCLLSMDIVSTYVYADIHGTQRMLYIPFIFH